MKNFASPWGQICPFHHCINSAVLQSSSPGLLLSCIPHLMKRKLRTSQGLCPQRSHWMCLRLLFISSCHCITSWNSPVWGLRLINRSEHRSPSGHVLHLHTQSQNPRPLLQLLACHPHSCCNYLLICVTPGKRIIDSLLVLVSLAARKEGGQVLHCQPVPTGKHQVVFRP